MSKLASFYFTHSETIVPIVTKLGLYQDDKPLTVENYEILKENRKWKSSIFDPFMSNLIFVLYKWAYFQWKTVKFQNFRKIVGKLWFSF